MKNTKKKMIQQKRDDVAFDCNDKCETIRQTMIVTWKS